MYKFLKNQDAQICLLQETHCTDRYKSIWTSQWGYKCLYSNGTSNAKGVAILLSKATANKISDIRWDIHGRYIMCKLKIQDSTICLANIYAPNEDNPTFFEEVYQNIEQMECTFTILGGDFKTILDPKLDRMNGKVYHKKNRDLILDKVNTQSLVDIWRDRNEKAKKFTWSKLQRSPQGKTLSWSRIDYFLVSKELSNLVQDCNRTPGFLSDHSLLSIELDFSEIARGPGYWRFNDKILESEEYVENMSKLIENTWAKYSYLATDDRWELLHHEVVRYSQEFSKRNANNKKWKKYNLYKLVEAMQDDLMQNPQNEDLKRHLPYVKKELEVIYEEEAKSAAFRSRCNFYEKGCKMTSYFFNLENHNYKNKTMYSIRKSYGELTKDYGEILNVQYRYYEKLYSKNPNVSFTLENDTGIKLTEVDKTRLDSEITLDEIFDAIMTLKTGKAPGMSGISLAFYQKFFKQIGPILLCLYKDCIARKKLNFSARCGVISLLPKKYKDLTYIDHWRPLTLLNYQYCILAKLIANRLDEVVHKIIGPQQTGFIAG